MALIRTVLLGLAALLLIAVGALYVTGHGYILTALQRTYLQGHVTANIDDHRAFETRTIAAGTPEPWPMHPEGIGDALPQALLDYLIAHESAAFLVIYEGQVFAERYFEPYGPRSKTNSFSMAKTVVSLMLGKAIEQGVVRGLDHPLIDLLPEFSDDPLAAGATIGMLSEMNSGYDWDEHYYSPFSPTVALLYGNDVGRFLADRSFVAEPGSTFYYSSASTQLLAIALTRALQRRDADATLSAYLSEHFWQPLGMNDDALWHLEGTGMELAYCCISTNARNFARIGQMMLQDGRWGERTVIDSDFVRAMHSPRAVGYYGLSTWINNVHTPNYYALRGHLGQYVMVIPDRDLVIVRLGRQIPPGRNPNETALPYFYEQVDGFLPAQ